MRRDFWNYWEHEALNNIREHLIIEGRVQGVWFRESTRRQALALGLTGYAKNLPDGAVDVLACGEPGSLDQLSGWLHEGPRLAQVRSVTESPAQTTCPHGFTIEW